MIQESRVVYLNRPEDALLWGALKAKLGTACFHYQTVPVLFKLLQVMHNPRVCLPPQKTCHVSCLLMFSLIYTFAKGTGISVVNFFEVFFEI